MLGAQEKGGRARAPIPLFTRPLSLPDVGQVRCGRGQK